MHIDRLEVNMSSREARSLQESLRNEEREVFLDEVMGRSKKTGQDEAAAKKGKTTAMEGEERARGEKGGKEERKGRYLLPSPKTPTGWRGCIKPSFKTCEQPSEVVSKSQASAWEKFTGPLLILLRVTRRHF